MTASPPPPPPADPADPADPIELMRIGLQGTATTRAPRWQPPAIQDLPSIPNVVVENFIGAGGMGAVYRARQTHLDRPVALKVLDPARIGDARFAERFAREARAMARLDHPAIVRLYDFGQAGSWLWLVIELVEGANLREVLRTGNLAPSEALRIAPQLCEALAHAHAAGVVHRDLKPENILIDGKGRPHIADFGLAKLRDDVGEQSATGAIIGTLPYMAPEQIAGAVAVDHRADLYALGVILYEMLTGTLPLGRFAAPSQSLHVDPRLDEVVYRSLERDPGRRYQSADDVRRAMEQATAAPPAQASGAPPPSAAAESASSGTPPPPPSPPPPPGTSSGGTDYGSLHIGPDGVSVSGLGGIGRRVRDAISEAVGDEVDRGSLHAGPPGVSLDGRQRGWTSASGEGPGYGERKLHRSGMLLTVGAALLTVWILSAGGGDGASGRVLDFALGSPADRLRNLTWAAAIAMGVGGISLIARAALPLAIIGGVGALLVVPWCWSCHWLVGLIAAFIALQTGHRVLRMPRLLRHYGSVGRGGRWWRWLLGMVLAAAGSWAAAWPYTHGGGPGPGPGPVPVPADGAALPHGPAMRLESKGVAPEVLCSWSGGAVQAARFHVSAWVRWTAVSGQAYLRLRTRMENGASLITRDVAKEGSRQAMSGSSGEWHRLVLPSTIYGTGTGVKEVELALVLPGPGVVEVADIELWPSGWPSGITEVPDLVEVPAPPNGTPVGPDGEPLEPHP